MVVETWFTTYMTTTNNTTATQDLADLFAAKYAEARTNGATDGQAIAACRLLWLDALKEG